VIILFLTGKLESGQSGKLRKVGSPSGKIYLYINNYIHTNVNNNYAYLFVSA
jgi:hypothetical protein